jgi:hypothetical protein
VDEEDEEAEEDTVVRDGSDIFCSEMNNEHEFNITTD